MSAGLFYSDDQIVKAIQTGDRKVLRYIYDRYLGIITQFIEKNNGTADEAQDIYQESVIACYQNFRKEGFELTCQFSTYLFAIAKRLWYKELQKKSSLYPIFSQLTGTEVLEDDLPFIQERERRLDLMDKSITQLGFSCQNLIKSFYIDKKNMQEIALEMGYTNADNAKNQKYKCLQKLKKTFFNIYNKEEIDERSIIRKDR